MIAKSERPKGPKVFPETPSSTVLRGKLMALRRLCSTSGACLNKMPSNTVEVRVGVGVRVSVRLSVTARIRVRIRIRVGVRMKVRNRASV